MLYNIDDDDNELFDDGDQRCVVMNSSEMTCTMPQVQLPTDFQVNDTVDGHVSVAAGGGVVSLRGGADDRDRADVYVGLLFDGFRYYANLTEAKPDVKFQFFELPTFDSLTDFITYRPQSLSDIVIMVSQTAIYSAIDSLKQSLSVERCRRIDFRIAMEKKLDLTRS